MDKFLIDPLPELYYSEANHYAGLFWTLIAQPLLQYSLIRSVMKDPDFYLLNDVTFQFFSRKISANFIDFHSEEEAL